MGDMEDLGCRQKPSAVRVSDVAWPDQRAPELQLQQVLLNLITNGFDAMDGQTETERTLSVRTSRRQEGGAVLTCGTPEQVSGGGVPRHAVRALSHDEDRGVGDGTGRLPFDCRGARGHDLGGEQ